MTDAERAAAALAALAALAEELDVPLELLDITPTRWDDVMEAEAESRRRFFADWRDRAWDEADRVFAKAHGLDPDGPWPDFTAAGD